jgi:hypothetical protein
MKRKRRRPTKRGGAGSGYEVGYGRPPKATQFKKGTSGNKKGRPKDVKNIASHFRDEMYQSVIISENGERRTVPKIKAILKQLANKAATGDPRAIQAIVNIARELGDLDLPDPVQEPKVRKFTLRIFEKDLATGEHVLVKPAYAREADDDE